ncbi:MAG TPA: cell division protein FtsQ/DivIB [Allosphingosinicella sp.]|nr:cell division protein FtsQ/DivIB [Allosphingosinicella sp.]
MSARIARGSATRSKSRSRAPARGRPGRRPQPPALDTLPLPAETVRRVSGWLISAMFLAFALAVLVAFRVPQMAGIAIGEAIGRGGFTVHTIEPKGLNRLKPMEVYRIASHQMGRPMPLIDLEGTRQQLLRFGWVKDARVSRRFPDTLVVDIVERTPAAIWQHNRQLMLIDPEGVVLEPVDLAAMPDLPLVIGPAANQHAAELSRLIAAAPELRPIMEGATWVGGRRWDIRFHSGELLALPEGEDKAARALARFAEMDRRTQLLGRGLVRFDMRIPGKMIVRVSREPGSIVSELPEPPANVPDTPAAAPPLAPAQQGEAPASQTI